MGPQAADGSTTQPVAHSWVNGSWLAREGYDNPPGYNSSGRAHMSLTSWGRLMHEVLRVEAGAATLANPAVAQLTTSSVVTLGPAVTYGMGWVSSRLARGRAAGCSSMTAATGSTTPWPLF